jgi:hypothetical protein
VLLVGVQQLQELPGCALLQQAPNRALVGTQGSLPAHPITVPEVVTSEGSVGSALKMAEQV